MLKFVSVKKSISDIVEKKKKKKEKNKKERKKINELMTVNLLLLLFVFLIAQRFSLSFYNLDKK